MEDNKISLEKVGLIINSDLARSEQFAETIKQKILDGRSADPNLKFLLECLVKPQYEKQISFLKELISNILKQDTSNIYIKNYLNWLQNHIDILPKNIQFLNRSVDLYIQEQSSINSDFQILPEQKKSNILTNPNVNISYNVSGGILKSKALRINPSAEQLDINTELFVERNDIVSTIKLKFQEQNQNRRRVVNIYGLRGAGKSKLTKRYLEITAQDYCYQIWLKGNTKEELVNSYKKLLLLDFELVNSIEGLNDEIIIYRVKKHLQSLPNFIIVFDDLSKSLSIEEFLPDVGDILITSEVKLVNESKAIKIGLLAQYDSILLVENVTGKITDNSEKQALVELVNKEYYEGHPQGLAQAAAIIKKQKKTISQFLHDLNQQKDVLASREISDISEEHIYKQEHLTTQATIELIRNHLLDEAKKENLENLIENLLDCLAYFGPFPIPYDALVYILIKVQGEFVYDEEAIKNTKFKLGRLLSLSEEYSLLEFSAEAISISALNQLALRNFHYLHKAEIIPVVITNIAKGLIAADFSIKKFIDNRMPRESAKEYKFINAIHLHLPKLLKLAEKNLNQYKKEHKITLNNLYEYSSLIYESLNERSLAMNYFKLANHTFSEYSFFANTKSKLMQTYNKLLRKSTDLVPMVESNIKSLEEDIPRIKKELERWSTMYPLICMSYLVKYYSNYLNLAANHVELALIYCNINNLEQAAKQLDKIQMILNILLIQQGQINPIALNTTIPHERLENGRIMAWLHYSVYEDITDLVKETAKILSNISTVYNYLHDIINEARFLNLTLKYKEILYGKKHIKMVNVLKRIAEIHDNNREYDQQKILMEEMLLIQQGYYGDKHPIIATTLIDLSNIYIRLMSNDNKTDIVEKRDLLNIAKGYCNRALKIQEDFYGNNHSLIEVTLNCLKNISLEYDKIENSKNVQIVPL